MNIIKYCIVLFLVFFGFENNGYADCYTCFSRYKVQLTLNDGSSVTGYAIAGYDEYYESPEAFIRSKGEVTLYEVYYKSTEEELTWKTDKPLPEFYIYSDDRQHKIETKNIAEIKSLATYSDDGIPFQIPYDTAKRLQGDSTAKIYHLEGLDQSEMRSEYFLVSLNGSLREGMLEEMEAIRVEETTSENRGAIDWTTILMEKLQLDPKQFLFIVIGSGC